MFIATRIGKYHKISVWEWAFKFTLLTSVMAMQQRNLMIHQILGYRFFDKALFFGLAQLALVRISANQVKSS